MSRQDKNPLKELFENKRVEWVMCKLENGSDYIEDSFYKKGEHLRAKDVRTALLKYADELEEKGGCFDCTKRQIYREIANEIRRCCE